MNRCLTMPLPVCVCTRSRRDRRLKSEADFGCCSAKALRDCGFKREQGSLTFIRTAICGGRVRMTRAAIQRISDTPLVFSAPLRVLRGPYAVLSEKRAYQAWCATS